MGSCTRALSALLAAAVVAACAPSGEELVATRPFPAVWQPQGDTGSVPFMAWLFRTEDCLSCDSFDYAVRRSQASLPLAVPLVAVHVGSVGDEQVPRSFFAARRIRVDRHLTVTPREFRRMAGASALPAVVLVKEGRIAWTSSVPQGVSTPAQFEGLVRAFHGTGARE